MFLLKANKIAGTNLQLTLQQLELRLFAYQNIFQTVNETVVSFYFLTDHLENITLRTDHQVKKLEFLKIFWGYFILKNQIIQFSFLFDRYLQLKVPQKFNFLLSLLLKISV